MANLVTKVAQVNCSLGAKTHPDSANLGSQLKHGFALARPGVTALVPMRLNDVLLHFILVSLVTDGC